MISNTVTVFLLMGFSSDRNLQILHFVMFFSIYFIALMGNFLIVTAVALNENRHSPMYFFLTNLSLLDICYISTIVPKSMSNSLTNNNIISFSGCITQIFLVLTFAGTELALLTVMAYGRYVAICQPLQYGMIMNWDACTQMATASWIICLLHALLRTSLTFRLNFCDSNTIGQFFCDISQLQKICCSDTRVNQILMFLIGIGVSTFCLTFIFVSHGYIFSTVLKLPSVESRHKAFSTCTPHLTVVSLFLSIAVFSYLRRKTLSSPTMDLLSAALYTVLPPVLNPIIYSLRNKVIQEAVQKIPQKLRSIS